MSVRRRRNVMLLFNKNEPFKLLNIVRPPDPLTRGLVTITGFAAVLTGSTKLLLNSITFPLLKLLNVICFWGTSSPRPPDQGLSYYYRLRCGFNRLQEIIAEFNNISIFDFPPKKRFYERPSMMECYVIIH